MIGRKGDFKGARSSRRALRRQVRTPDVMERGGAELVSKIDW